MTFSLNLFIPPLRFGVVFFLAFCLLLLLYAKNTYLYNTPLCPRNKGIKNHCVHVVYIKSVCIPQCFSFASRPLIQFEVNPLIKCFFLLVNNIKNSTRLWGVILTRKPKENWGAGKIAGKNARCTREDCDVMVAPEFSEVASTRSFQLHITIKIHFLYGETNIHVLAIKEKREKKKVEQKEISKLND